MDSELFDILDENGDPTGKVCTRREAHEKGIHHRTAHIWLVSDDGQLLLQKRSRNKDSFPGCWDISAAGHLTAGTDYLEGAKRELREELGIDADCSELQLICRLHKNVTAEFGGRPFHDCETAAVFIYTGDFDADSLVLQEDEVECVMLMSPEDIIKGMAEGSLPNCLDIREIEAVRAAIIKKLGQISK